MRCSVHCPGGGGGLVAVAAAVVTAGAALALIESIAAILVVVASAAAVSLLAVLVCVLHRDGLWVARRPVQAASARVLTGRVIQAHQAIEAPAQAISAPQRAAIEAPRASLADVEDLAAALGFAVVPVHGTGD